MTTDKKKVETARKALATLEAKLSGTLPSGSCTVFLHSKAGRDKADHWKRVKFDAALATSFRSGVVAGLKKRLDAKDEVEPYSYDDMVSGHIGFWPQDEDQTLNDWFNAVPDANWPHIFDGDQKFLGRVNFHSTVIPLSGEELTVFRHRGSASLTHKGGLMAIFNTTSHQFKELAGKVFHFDHGVDFILWDAFVFILDHTRFESLTHIRDLTITKAKSALNRVEKLKDIEVANIDKLVERVARKPLLARRIASAEQMDVLKALTGKAMVERIKTLNLPLRHKDVDGKIHFEIDADNPTQVQEFINLITDYYLRSPLTDKEYRVPSKYPN